MKKISLILLAAILAISALAGCGSKATETAAGSSGSGQSSGSSSSKTGGSESESKGFDSMTLAVGHATSDSENSHYQAASLKFKELVEKATDGKVKIEIHPNGELGGEREMIEAVQLGTLDLVLTSSGPLGNFASKSNAFDFPFLFRDREHAYKVLDGEIGGEVNKQLEEVGITILAWGENGFRNMTNSKRPIIKPEDLKGIKIRTMENKVHLDSFREFGADPTPMAFTELFTSMQQGVVDGQENPLSVIMPNKFYEAQKHLTLSGHFYSPAPLLIGKAKFESFSPELQKVVLESAAGARDYMRQFIADKNAGYLKIAKENGMEIITREEFDYDAFLAASKPVYDKYKKEYGDVLDKVLSVK
jgi:tripartite ATP-independent transporter DctP family solute receptor